MLRAPHANTPMRVQTIQLHALSDAERSYVFQLQTVEVATSHGGTQLAPLPNRRPTQDPALINASWEMSPAPSESIMPSADRERLLHQCSGRSL
jgi:hypothetical protein